MAYQMAATAVTLKAIHRLRVFSNAICRTFVQHLVRFQLTVCSHGSFALAELLVYQFYGNLFYNFHHTFANGHYRTNITSF